MVSKDIQITITPAAINKIRELGCLRVQIFRWHGGEGINFEVNDHVEGDTQFIVEDIKIFLSKDTIELMQKHGNEINLGYLKDGLNSKFTWGIVE